jgi:hypothetical protein
MRATVFELILIGAAVVMVCAAGVWIYLIVESILERIRARR